MSEMVEHAVRARAPLLTEFMVRGIDLRDALFFRSKWSSLSDADKEGLGFRISDYATLAEREAHLVSPPEGGAR